MLKNKFKLITILMLIILIFTIPIVRGANETNDENLSTNQVIVNEDPEANKRANQEANQTSDSNEQSNIENEQSNIENELTRDDVYLSGDDITIDYNIDGNLFVMANNVTINSQIGGDVFVLSNNLTIKETGYIYNNLFVASNNITINGIVNNLYCISKAVTINGYIYRDIKSISNTINIIGTIGRNAYISCDSLSLSQENNGETFNATIIGNLNYVSSQEVSIPENVVSGQVTFDKINTFDENNIQKQVISMGTFVITVIVIWLLCLWLAPKFMESASSILTKKTLPVVGLGILTPIALVILSILLLVLPITSTIGLLSLIALFVLLAISTSIFVITVNNIICTKLNVTTTKNKFGILVITAIILWLIGLIPYISPIIALIAVILGLGLITYSLLFKKKIKKTEN